MKNILYQESIVEIKHLFRVMKITALALFYLSEQLLPRNLIHRP